ncbi:MAG: PilZ domain-containing protein [Desulfobacterales bacterium]
MAMIEKRRHPRVDSLNLSYVCMDEDGNVTGEGMGRTLNVSESGILLETSFRMVPGQIISLTVAIGEYLLDVKGQVIRCTQSEEKTFLTGIEFEKLDLEGFAILRKFVKLFQTKKTGTGIND